MRRKINMNNFFDFTKNAIPIIKEKIAFLEYVRKVVKPIKPVRIKAKIVLCFFSHESKTKT